MLSTSFDVRIRLKDLEFEGLNVGRTLQVLGHYFCLSLSFKSFVVRVVSNIFYLSLPLPRVCVCVCVHICI